MVHLDPVTRALMPVLRYFHLAIITSASGGWRHGYEAAIGTWSEARGLAIAHAAQKFVYDLARCGLVAPIFKDPLDLVARETISSDEARILLLLHYMQTDDTARAWDLISHMHQGQIDPCFVRHGLALSAKLDANAPVRATPRLTLVS